MNKNEIIQKFGEEYYNQILERNRKNYQHNKEKWKLTRKKYYENNKSYFDKHNSEYYNSIHGRALNLLHSYQTNDLKYNRGTCEIDEDFIINNIFSKSCVYCGESDYLKLGCDRIDNSKPHTPDNVVPCCGTCNLKRQKSDFVSFFIQQYFENFILE